MSFKAWFAAIFFSTAMCGIPYIPAKIACFFIMIAIIVWKTEV